jgi:UDP-N-acetylglucosamine 2-epimerase (non-hydrolysing)
MAKSTIACVLGTRPDAIKMAPVILELKKFPEVNPVVLSTGQHREMLAQALAAFGLTPDHDLDLMVPGQSLGALTSRALAGLDEALDRFQPHYVLGQGDTSTTFCASLAAFYRRIPFGHVEAGLRTPTIDSPFPEEFNRRATALVADLHFPPTPLAFNNLVQEGRANLVITGNTGIDAVMKVASLSGEEWFPEHPGRVLLLTTHRRENLGGPQRDFALAARELLERFPDLLLVLPMHRNPEVRASLLPILGDHPRARLIEPPDYAPFVRLLKRSTIIMTDSGGVQEEAPSFGVPVLVLRESTERPEGVEQGVARLVGTDRSRIVEEASLLLSSPAAHAAMVTGHSPYGDGRAAERIRYHVLKRLGIDSPSIEPWAS